MDQNAKNECRCEKTGCGCPAAVAEPCKCGGACDCARACKCGGCNCGASK